MAKVETTTIDERRLALEEQKWSDEKDLRHRELDAKLGESGWSTRISPLMVTLAAGILTLAGSVVGALIQGANTLQLEREKFDSSEKLEEQKQQHELILKMISVGDEDQARSNIRFLAETGLIKDDALAKKLLEAKAQAVLPTPQGTSPAPPTNADLLKKVSQNAIDLIVEGEVGSKDSYTQRYSHPFAVGGQSGVTIGIGYDLGYVTASQFRSDWRQFLTDDALDRLQEAVGVRGPAAKPLADKLQEITVSYDNAVSQFVSTTLPKLAATLEANLENTADLPQDAYGALLALIYERGPSFKTQGDRFSEMRTIADLMAGKRYTEIPAQIRSMKRLYASSSSLGGPSRRLEAEASLFDDSFKAKPEP